MLTLYRRHLSSCEHKKKGRTFKRCKCPIWIQGTVEGQTIRKSLDVDAWERAEKIKREIENGNQPKESITIEAALTGFLADCEARKLNASTRSKYKLLRDNLAAFSGRHNLHRISELQTEEVRRYREGRVLNPRTAGKELERIRAFFNFCIHNDWITKNPAKAIKAPQVRPSPTLPFSDSDISKILLGADFRTSVFFRVLLHSGLRIIDAAILRPERLENGKLFLYVQKTGTPVRIPLPPDLVEDLAKLKLVGGYYFVIGSEVPTTVAERYRVRLIKICKKQGIPKPNPHRFRDTFACNLLLKGVPLETVSILLGHTDIKTTQKSYWPWIQGLQDNLELAVAKTWLQPKLVRVK